ncbi:MAG TPA: tRNA lysidine(34) synthetase TilS [Bacteroidales bacterium]|nr:tRNA lysidine(34) synthetase TilS [Bacteroidales bacterium]
MLETLQNYIRENNLLKNGERVLLAVSGGIDSMVMAHLFCKLPYSTGIAHCNFKLRSADSDKDEDLVRNYCSLNNIPFYSVSFETSKYATEKGISIQMAARDLRYAWFEEIRKKEGFDKIATAHNLNDNIETMIINLVRGSGLTGLTGIRSSAGFIIRPLLFASRETISGYCSTNGIVYREDKSNSEVKYMRNKIRHLVIPVLKEINPSIENTLVEAASRFSDISMLMNEYTDLIRERISNISGDMVIFNQSALTSYLNNRTLLYEIFRTYGLRGNGIEDLVNIIEGRTGSYLSTETHRIYNNRDEIIVKPLSDVKDEPVIFNSLEDINCHPYLSAEIISVSDDFLIPEDPSTACIDAERIEYPLIFRRWEYGDRFIPLGMSNQKKLSDYFIDRKYSIPDKEKKKVLVSGGNIIWIAGVIIDNRYRITSSTSKILLIKYKK